MTSLGEVLSRSRQSSAAVIDTIRRQPFRWALYCLWFVLLVSLVEILFLARSTALGYRVVQPRYPWWIPLGYLMICAPLTAITTLLLRRARAASFYWGLLFVLGFVAAFGGIAVVRKVAPVAGAFLAAGVAVQLARTGASHAFLLDRVIRRSFALLAVIVLAFAGRAALAPWLAEQRVLSSLPRAEAGRPNVLFIVLDTVRASSLGLYGDPRARTPNLDRLARQGVRFERAISPAPWTLPAHASLFTGHWPSELGAGQYKPLDGRYPTLAEQFTAHGYVTSGFAANMFYAGAEYGLARGFSRYVDHPNVPLRMIMQTAAADALESQLTFTPYLTSHEEKWMVRSAATINENVLAWLAARDRSRPFFAFLNYIDAHDPYLAPDTIRQQFTTAPPVRDLPTYTLDRYTPEEIRGLHGSYDATVAWLDQQIGALFGALERTGALGNTVVVITADHGEHFGEHNLLQHAGSLYMPLLHVPLFVLYPGHVPRDVAVAEPVSTRDIAATLADLTGLSDSPLPGRSLREYWTPDRDHAPAPRDIVSEVDRLVPGYPDFYPARQGAMKSIVVGSHHYIVNYGTQKEELYDLAVDPDELHDLGPGRPDLLREYRERVERTVRAPGRRVPAPAAPPPAR
ncbi:MAG: sulfatase-like hydrolase/transferase [Vicinamibacterales bacterium]